MAKLVVDGLEELAAELRVIDRRLPRAITKAHRGIAREVGMAGRRNASRSFGPHARAARAIKWSATTKAARVRLDPNTDPRVLAAEFGVLSHPVFGKRMSIIEMRSRPFPIWKGNQWTQGAGPPVQVGYAANPAVRQAVQSGAVAEQYADRIMDALAKAFPEVV